MMTLYVKNGCPWCDMAEEWLRTNGKQYHRVDVIASRDDYAEMRRISGQSKAPVLVTTEGRVLADFGPEELPGFLK
jgi:glutaredoxin